MESHKGAPEQDKGANAPSGDLKMNQIRAKHSVTAIADRLKKAGKHPTLRAVRAEADLQRNEIHQQNISSLKWGGQARAIKTHVADLPSEVRNLLAEEFEQKVIALRQKLESEYAEIKRGRNELAVLNERQFARIEALKATLKDASAKIAEQAGLIAQLKNEIAVGREALAKAEQRIIDARQGLTRVEHTLDDPFPESSGGA
jgi:chromosome segregation ATPase